MATKAKIDNWGQVKIRASAQQEETIIRVKWQPTKWEKNLASYPSNNTLVTRIYKE